SGARHAFPRGPIGLLNHAHAAVSSRSDCVSVCVCVFVCVCVCGYESGGLSLCESTLWLTRGDDLSCAEERAGGLACRGGHSPAKKDHDNQGVLWLHERGG